MITCMYIYICVCVCMYGWMDGCMYVRMYVCKRTYVCVGVLLVNSNIKYYCRNKYIQYIYLSIYLSRTGMKDATSITNTEASTKGCRGFCNCSLFVTFAYAVTVHKMTMKKFGWLGEIASRKSERNAASSQMKQMFMNRICMYIYIYIFTYTYT